MGRPQQVQFASSGDLEYMSRNTVFDSRKPHGSLVGRKRSSSRWKFYWNCRSQQDGRSLGGQSHKYCPL